MQINFESKKVVFRLLRSQKKTINLFKITLKRLFMKIMILSYSHSMTKQTLLQFIKNHPASYYIHCGDIYMPYTPLEVDHFYNVRGNNDFVDLPKDLTIHFSRE